MNLAELLTSEGGKSTIVIATLGDLQQLFEDIARNRISETERLKSQQEESISPVDVCRELGVSRTTLTRWQKSGYLVPAKVGGKVFYSRKQMNKLVMQAD